MEAKAARAQKAAAALAAAEQAVAAFATPAGGPKEGEAPARSAERKRL